MARKNGRTSRSVPLHSSPVRLGSSVFSDLQSGAPVMADAGTVRYGSHMEEMRIDKLRAGEHQLHAYCHHCDRWSARNIAEMLPQWRDLEHVPAVVPCADCGELGMLKVRHKLSTPSERAPPFFLGWSLAG